jgi:hypothetical protein
MSPIMTVLSDVNSGVGRCLEFKNLLRAYSVCAFGSGVKYIPMKRKGSIAMRQQIGFGVAARIKVKFMRNLQGIENFVQLGGPNV